MMKATANLLTIAIIGGGVAGMSCALWLKQLGFTPIIIEQNTQLGGQLRHLDRINRWVLGSLNKTSVELAENYANHIKNEVITALYQTHLVSVTPNSTGYELLIENADGLCEYNARGLVIATGVRVLSHEIFGDTSGFHTIYENGLISFFPIAHLDELPKLKGKTIAVIGGSDNAHYTAKDLALAGAHVYLLMRSNPKARPMVRKEVEDLIEQQLITEHTDIQISAFQQRKEHIEITFIEKDATLQRISIDKIFARTGFTANSEFLDAFEAFSGIAKEAGYIKTDSAKRTSLPWIYAIGDVANAKHQSVVSAIAEGAIAAQDISERV